MIKFFRNIRKSLLNKGNTTNYLKYAFGEIVLVVIGILIALQINNWNEGRKLQIDKHKLMLALKEEFITNKKNLEDILTGTTISDLYFAKILNFSAGTEPNLPIDSLRFYTSKMIYSQKLSLLTSVQEEAISSGKFELLDDNLKQLLSTFKDFNNSLNSINEKSDYSLTNDQEMYELFINLSIYENVYIKFFPNRPVSLHPELKKNDVELVTYLQSAKTYASLYRIYFVNITNEIWMKEGLLELTNNILDEIEQKLTDRK